MTDLHVTWLVHRWRRRRRLLVPERFEALWPMRQGLGRRGARFRALFGCWIYTACFSKIVRADACCLERLYWHSVDMLSCGVCIGQQSSWTLPGVQPIVPRWWRIGQRFNLISGPNIPDPDRAFVSVCLPPSSAIAVFSCSWSPFVCIYSLPVGGK